MSGYEEYGRDYERCAGCDRRTALAVLCESCRRDTLLVTMCPYPEDGE